MFPYIFLLGSLTLERAPLPAQGQILQLDPTPTWPTTVWSTVLTTSSFIQSINDRHWTIWETMTISTIPVPLATLSAYPTTVTQTVITYNTAYGLTTYLQGYPSMSTDTSISSTIYTDEKTYFLVQPQPTDLPAGTGFNDLPCQQCLPGNTSIVESPQCAAMNLYTGCQGQCEQRTGGIWWCYYVQEYEYDLFDYMRMGRACWGGDLDYEQLNEPCVQGDYGVGCVPCQGQNLTWRAQHWV